MQHYNLYGLNEIEQADVIMEQGVLVGERKDEFYNVRLFQVGAFYAEIYYHSHFNVIIKIKSFNNTDLLEPYLRQVDIAGLLN